jgi:hypothetical protein
MKFLAALTRRPGRQPATPVAAKPLPAAAPLLALPPPRPEPAPLPPPKPRFDLRSVSPRRFAEIAHELYIEGTLRWQEYQLVGFPSELHPAYASTIGALTGERADPDRPRDMLGQWESRVDFMRRFQDHGLRHAERAVEILRKL